MNVYQTDANGFYIADTVADESPLEPGVFLLPGGCVTTPPPAPQAGYRARWHGEGWDLVAQAQEVVVTSPEMTPQQVLAAWRTTARCSRMQGILALGEKRWATVMEYRATATWSEVVVIDYTTDWVRNSETIQLFGWLLQLTDTDIDALFTAAQEITA